MAKKETFTFTPLPSQSTNKEDTKKEPEYIPTIQRISLDISTIFLEKVKDYGYWEGLNQSEVICAAVDLFFNNKTINPRPEKVKNKRKPGRKPKF